MLIVGAGSGDEQPSRSGLAHLTEHVVAEAKHDGWSLAERVRRLGVRANAMTSWDDTTYFALDDAGALEDLVAMLNVILTEPTAGVDEAMLERERRAVLNELRLRTENGTPGQAAGWLMSATFAAGHPYARPVAGTPESISAITLDDVRSFAAAHYRPDQSTLVVSAPLPLDEIQALVQRGWGAREARPRVRGPAVASGAGRRAREARFLRHPHRGRARPHALGRLGGSAQHRINGRDSTAPGRDSS